MRVGLVCPYSLTVPGGVQGQVLALARSLRALGHPTRVLGPCDGPPPEAGVTPLGNSISTDANGSVAPLAPDPAAQLRFIRALRDEDFSVLHLHEPLVPGPTMTALLTRQRPMVGTFHAAGGSPYYRHLNAASRWLARRLDLRCAVSVDARQMAQEALGGTYELLFNGIEVDRFAKASPWPTEGPTILFVGRHEPRKGLAVLLDALAALPPDVRVWVAGAGPETAQLRVRAAGEPRIQWLGRISDEEKAQRLRGADVYCAPSLGGESFGVVLLEAMAASTPIVASDLPGYRNVARPGVEATLVEPGDAEQLGRALLAALAGGPEVAAQVIAGDARAAAFSMDQLAELYLERYARVVAAGAARRLHRRSTD